MTQHLLDVLSRSRRTPSTAGKSIDTKVIRLSQLRAEGGTGVAVVRVARDPRGATQLRAQHRLVAEVASQPGLDMAWRGLVPRVLAFDERPDATVCVETFRPGVQLAEVLQGDPSRLEELIAVALSAIAPLHRATTRPIVVDNLSAIRQWVVDPVADVARVCGQANTGLLPGLERLEAALTRALVGRRMTVCWTHGDYTPESIFLAGARGQVNRIVGWDKAREDRPALIDNHLLVLAASAQVEGVELGTIVSRRLMTGGLSDSERDALQACGVEESECIDGRAAILLAWLQHVAVLCRNGSDLPKDGKLGTSVASVIDAVDAWRGSDEASALPSADRTTTADQGCDHTHS